MTMNWWPRSRHPSASARSTWLGEAIEVTTRESFSLISTYAFVRGRRGPPQLAREPRAEEPPEVSDRVLQDRAVDARARGPVVDGDFGEAQRVAVRLYLGLEEVAARVDAALKDVL